MYRLDLTVHAGGLAATLRDGEGPVRPAYWKEVLFDLPPVEWAAVSALFDAWSAADAGVSADDVAIHLDAGALSRLSQDDRDSLRIPGPFTGVVRVRERGAPDRPELRWEFDWKEGDGSVMGPPGAWVGPRAAPMAPELLPLIELNNALAVTGDEEARCRLIVRLKALAAAHPRRITLDRGLSERKITVLDAFRLAIEVGADGSASPVPVLGTATEAGFDSARLSDAQVDELALGTLGVKFGVLRKGRERIVIPREVAQNLTMTRAARRAPRAERERFVENPENFLPFAEAFDREDYADRVVGLAPPPPPAPRVDTSPPGQWLVNTGVLLDCPAGSVWVDGPRIPGVRAELQAALAQGKSEIRVDGVAVPVRQEVIEHLERLEAEPAAPKPGEKPIPKPPMLVLAIRENVEAVEYHGAERPRPDPRPEAWRPEALKSPLKPHQIDGLAWLRTRWTAGTRGAMLCDDMGLGKTLQALVFAAWASERLDRDRVDVPVVLVGPVSLLDGWLEELDRHLAPSAFARVMWGQTGTRPAARPDALLLEDYIDTLGADAAVLQENRLNLERFRRARPDLLLMSYDTLRRYQLSFGRLRIGMMILDEAQQIKHDAALRSRAARAMNYDFGLALTGTPIENRWEDLWTIADFAVPGFLGSAAQFRQDFPSTGDVRAVGEQLGQRASAILLRRTRAQALQGLPGLTQHVERWTMPDAQRQRYVEAATTGDPRGMLALVQQLAQIALHPRVQAVIEDADSARAWASESVRTQVAWKYLETWARERRPVLLFARSIAFQETLRVAIDKTFRPLAPTVVLNGQVATGKRSALVARFRDGVGFRVMIVSPDVGGTGWNLQFTARAILLERPWNPAVESQMVARVHRLGQKEPVEVVTPIGALPDAQGRSFDDILHAILGGKLELFHSVLAPIVIEQGEFLSAFAAMQNAVRGETDGAAVTEVFSGGEPAPVAPEPTDDERISQFLAHIDEFGTGTEVDARRVFGGPTAFRRLRARFEEVAANHVFAVKTGSTAAGLVWHRGPNRGD